MQNATQTQLKQPKKRPPADDSPRSHGSFRKWYSKRLPKWQETELSSAHMLVRIVFAVIFFVLIDQAISVTFNSRFDPLFDNNYRFKTGTDITPISLYVNHIKRARIGLGSIKAGTKQTYADQTHAMQTPAQPTTIAFLGSSPTYGHRIKNSANTYPYSFEKELNAIATKQAEQINGVANRNAGVSSNIKPLKNSATTTVRAPKIKVYNLASNGQLVSDQYFIAKSLINDVDTFVIQLNYHTFNKADDKRPAIRYPDIPKRLGVDVSNSEAALLDSSSSGISVSNSESDKANASLSCLLASASFTYANRDFITGELFGGPPEQLLLNLFGTPDTGKNPKSGELFGESNKPFSELKPVQQMLIIKTVSDLYDFKIDTADREVIFLRKLVDLLAEHKKKAVFFITPLNVEALDQFGIFNWDAYDSNSRILQSVVEYKKLKFIDANAGTDVLSTYDFFDISHTLDDGGAQFGRELAGKTSRYFLENSEKSNSDGRNSGASGSKGRIGSGNSGGLK
jgi:hypothetical protein